MAEWLRHWTLCRLLKAVDLSNRIGTLIQIKGNNNLMVPMVIEILENLGK